ncbi:PASTA domain-containing protein [Gordonibacter sp. 28C]|uniref:PASTA domain-containing protein n=1 Tax=Gordonibacter sp. 28C TaxID=2078569 RepID=UPI001F546A33|nr:PASTA domain-containing protein [Gordonibacter sp. 28C]
MSMICPNCRSDNKEGAKFCNECGFPLTGRMAAVAAASTSDATLRSIAADGPADEDAAAPSVDEGPDGEGVPEAAEAPGAGEGTSGEDDAPEPAPKKDAAARSSQGSGPLDPASLPVIGLAGVDVDEDGNEFDFGDIDDADPADARAEDEGRDARVPSAAVTADLSGLDECLVDPGYTPPQAAWRSGGTMEMPRVEGKAAPKQKEFRAPDPREKKHGRGRVVVIVLVLLAVAAAAAAGITYQMEMWGGKIVPDVTGMTRADATYQLEGKGFTVRATQVKSDETEGLVLLTDPEAGWRAEKGTEVVIHVAVARTIPDVVGKPKDEAAKLLEAEDFERVTFVDEKSDTAEGTVLAVSPDAGEKAKATTNVTVTVAVPFTVPDVANQTLDAAKAALEEAAYVPEVAYYYTEDVPEGTVVGTNPAAGEKLASGSMVTVNVAKSRASVLVAAAKDYLASAGTLSIGGTTYEIISVDSVEYTAYNQTSFTVTAAAVTTLDGETVRGSAKQKSGTIVWDDSNNIVSIS